MDFYKTLQLLTETITDSYIPVNPNPRSGNNAKLNGKEGYLYKNTVRGVKYYFKADGKTVELETLDGITPIGELKDTIDYNKNKVRIPPSKNSRFD